LWSEPLIGRNVEVVEPDDAGLDGTAQVATQAPSPWE